MCAMCNAPSITGPARRRPSGPAATRARAYIHPCRRLSAQPFAVPSVHLDVADGVAIIDAFMLANSNLTATVSGRLTDYGAEAPAVAGLSSIGPAAVDAYAMLKPDVIAPGINVFAPTAAATPGGATTGVMLSGTSMASPHVAGAAALVKSKHPRLASLARRPAAGRGHAQHAGPLVFAAALSSAVRAEIPSRQGIEASPCLP